MRVGSLQQVTVAKHPIAAVALNHLVKFKFVDRFKQVVGLIAFKCALLVFLVIPSEHNNICAGIGGLYLLDEIKPVAVGQFYVEEKQVGLQLCHQFTPLAAQPGTTRHLKVGVV